MNQLHLTPKEGTLSFTCDSTGISSRRWYFWSTPTNNYALITGTWKTQRDIDFSVSLIETNAPQVLKQCGNMTYQSRADSRDHISVEFHCSKEQFEAITACIESGLKPKELAFESSGLEKVNSNYMATKWNDTVNEPVLPITAVEVSFEKQFILDSLAV